MAEGKGIALVTGAGSGIGEAVAVAWRRPASPRPDRPAARAARPGRGPDRAGADAIPADLTDPGSVAALFAGVKARHGRLDVLFNNAGTNAPPVNLEDLTVEQWRGVSTPT